MRWISRGLLSHSSRRALRGESHTPSAPVDDVICILSALYGEEQGRLACHRGGARLRHPPPPTLTPLELFEMQVVLGKLSKFLVRQRDAQNRKGYQSVGRMFQLIPPVKWIFK